MFDFYVTIRKETPEVMILDHDVLRTRSYLWRNLECDRPLILFVNCDWIFGNTAQYHWGFTLKLEYKVNFLHKTHKRQDISHTSWYRFQ